MNVWLVASAALLSGFVPCLWVILKGSDIDRLVGAQFASVLAIFTLLLMAVGYNQPSFTDLALTLAVLSLPAGLVIAHFMERWV